MQVFLTSTIQCFPLASPSSSTWSIGIHLKKLRRTPVSQARTRPLSMSFNLFHSGVRKVHACIARAVYVNLRHVFVADNGIIWYAWHSWEWLTSLDFDWQYLSRQKRFRWPMVSSTALVVTPRTDIPRRSFIFWTAIASSSRWSGCKLSLFASSFFSRNWWTHRLSERLP